MFSEIEKNEIMLALKLLLERTSEQQEKLNDLIHKSSIIFKHSEIYNKMLDKKNLLSFICGIAEGLTKQDLIEELKLEITEINKILECME